MKYYKLTAQDYVKIANETAEKSIAQLAIEIGCSGGTIINAQRALKKAGVLKVRKNRKTNHALLTAVNELKTVRRVPVTIA